MIDYMVTQAVAYKVSKEDEDAAKRAERKQQMKQASQDMLQYT